MKNLAILLVLILTGCASVPNMNTDDCNPEVRDVVTAVERAIPFTCIEAPEIIELPTYEQLINLPPAEKCL